MKFKKPSILILTLFCTYLSFGQIKVSEFIQDSQLAKQPDNSLYFVDYWATWCIPCAHVKTYLSTLQKQYSDNFYILSLSEENPDKVKRYLKKRPTNLAIAIDYNSENFAKNNIITLPYGILYNAKGEKLWEGHSADLKPHIIDKFLRQQKKKIAVEKMFKAEKPLIYIANKTYYPKEDFEYFELNTSEEYFQSNFKDDYLELKGNLKEVLAYTQNVCENQIEIPESLNKSYQFYVKYNTNAFNDITLSILSALKLQKNDNYVSGEALVFEIEQPTFWDTYQIDWGTKREKFLVGDSEIEADNASLEKVTYTLSNLLETPIVISGNYLNNKPHDWQIHYKYFELMTSSLSDNYGIEVQKKITNYPQYIITKKTP